MSILERLYHGNLCPIEDAIPYDMDYRSLAIKISDEREYFSKTMSKKDKKRFNKWNKMIFRYEDTMEYAYFAYGFKLGVILASEVYAGNNH